MLAERTSCNILQTVFDPDNTGSGKSIGDIDARLGKIRVASRTNTNFRHAYRDPGLAILPADLIGPHHVLYLVIFHPTHNDIILGCAKIKPRKAITAKLVMFLLSIVKNRERA